MHRVQRGLAHYIIQPLLLVFLILGIFGIVWLRSNICSTEYNIGRLQKQKDAALKERKIIMAARAAALSIEEVEARGIQRAGLFFPNRKQVLYVKREATGGVYRVSIRGMSKLNEQKGGNP